MHLNNSGEFVELSTLNELKDWSSNGGNIVELISQYEKEASSPGKWTMLGHCYAMSGNYIQSIASYKEALQLSESPSLDIWLGIGEVYRNNNQPVLAELAYKSALELSTDSCHQTELDKQLGRTYRALGELAKSADHYAAFLSSNSVDPQANSQVLCELASVRQAQNRNEEAFQLLSEALELTKQNFKVFEFMGWHHFLTGNYIQALADLQKALELARDRCLEVGDIHYLIGRCHLAMGNSLESQGAIQRAIYKNPESYIFWCSMGILYALSTQAQDAFDCFVKACKVFPDSSLMWFNIGLLYEHCKQKQEAAMAYQRAVSLDSSNTIAIERQNVLSVGLVNEDIPEFIHPIFEIQETPFSNTKAKMNERLPDITQQKHSDKSSQSPVSEMIGNPTSANEAPPAQTLTPVPIQNYIQGQSPAQQQSYSHPAIQPSADSIQANSVPNRQTFTQYPMPNGQFAMNMFNHEQYQAMVQYQMMLVRQLASNTNGELFLQWLSRMENRNRDPERETDNALNSHVAKPRERKSSDKSSRNKKHK